jgi:hypothetical protein
MGLQILEVSSGEVAPFGGNQDAAGSAGAHEHCFCRQDTGGRWVCCRCGAPLIPGSYSYFPPSSQSLAVGSTP